MSWLTGKWSRRYPLMAQTIGERWKDHYPPSGTPGVYRLIALDGTGTPVPINRACGVDRTGTLQIGASRDLKTRLGSLVRTHQSNPRHGNGSSHRALSARLSAHFPPDRLALAWQLNDAPGNRETELLREYEARFGDTPPHNRQSGG
jgi:hypothetical protein